MIITRRACLRSALAGGSALLAARGAAWAVEAGPVAETHCGKVRGASVKGVHIFRGIPYGGPTEGAGRFLPPANPAKWTGVRDDTVTGPRCLQEPGNIFLSPAIGEYFGGGRPDRVELAKQTDSENCLVLNVLTPGLRGRRPVMVYIHGGGYSGGSSLLTLFGDGLPREQDVVLVGVNHRLNVFGYTYLGGLSDRYAVGNVGQLDLVAALEWVRDNIAAFGGDPGNVTIFGESGGGAKISTLLAMPSATGLFHKAAVQSGSMLHADDRETGTARAKALLAKLGLTEKQVDDLQKVPATKLFAASKEVGAGIPGEEGPVVDGHSIPRQTWDPKAPEISARIPLLIGNCKDEATLFVLQDSGLFRLDDAGLRDRLAKAGVPPDKVDPLLAAYRRDHPQESPTDLFFRISTDRGARWNATRQAELKLEQGKAGVFLYYFQWNTPLVDGKIKAFHTADLPLTMRLVRYPESERLSRQLSGAWAAFARSGDPSQKGLPWPAYNTSQRATMVFDADRSAAVNDPDRKERLLLRDLPSGSLL
jgi:para-nitrobenzyl esterase